MLQHTRATVLCREVAEACSISLILPLFLLASRAFRRRFLTLLKLDIHAPPRPTLPFTRHPRLASLKRLIFGKPVNRRLRPPPPRWSWGKGWRQSYSMSPPDENGLNDVESVLDDPDMLDAMVEQHNAYAASEIGTELCVTSPPPLQRYIKSSRASSSKRWAASSRRSSSFDYL